MKLKWNFLGGGGAKQKTSVGVVWILSGTSQFQLTDQNG